MADPAENEYTLHRGASRVLEYPVTGAPDDDPPSGWTVVWTLRRTPGQVDPPLLQIAAVWDADEELFEVPITRAHTLSLRANDAAIESGEADPYVASLFRTDAGSEEVLALDQVTVAQGIRDDRLEAA